MLKKEDILHIADLARLSLNDGECDLFQNDLNEIVEFALRISESTNIETPKTLLKFESLRGDTEKQQFEHNEILENAPESENGYFSVSKVIADD